MLALETNFSQEFGSKSHKYISEVAAQKTLGSSHQAGHVGQIRSAGSGAGNFTFISLFESGHMVCPISFQLFLFPFFISMVVKTMQTTS